MKTMIGAYSLFRSSNMYLLAHLEEQIVELVVGTSKCANFLRTCRSPFMERATSSG